MSLLVSMETLADSRGFNAALLTQAQELVHVGTWTWDIATDTVLWSDELFRLFGLAPQSLTLGLDTYLSFVHPGDRERVAGIIGESLRMKAPFRYDCRLVRRDGSWFYLHSRGCVICDETGAAASMIGTAMDVTDRRQQEEALRQSEARLRSIYEQSAVGLALTDAYGRFISVNASFAGFLCETPDALLGRSFIDITHSEDIELTRRMMEYTETTRRSPMKSATNGKTGHSRGDVRRSRACTMPTGRRTVSSR